MVYCYDDMSNGSSPKIANAFALGCNGIVTRENKYLGGQSFFFGSLFIWDNVILKAIKSKNNWYYGDHCYFGKRFRFFRITKNAFQNNGNGYSDSTRFKNHNIEIKPWRTGTHIVVCPPDDAFANLHGFSANTWIEKTNKKLKKNSDRPIIWRDRLSIQKPLQEDLQDAHALVTYMSNAAVDSLIEGVPVFCNGECSGKYMGLSDFSKIEEPIYPDNRLMFMSILADNQWTLDEIRNGMCWNTIGENNEV